jgi:hypothetical protein
MGISYKSLIFKLFACEYLTKEDATSSNLPVSGIHTDTNTQKTEQKKQEKMAVD